MAKASDQDWYVYMVRCADQSLYTGVTTDVARRVDEHNLCDKKAARYTRTRRPVALAYTEAATDRAAACKREAQLKRLPKHAKEQLATNAKPLTDLNSDLNSPTV